MILAADKLLTSQIPPAVVKRRVGGTMPRQEERSMQPFDVQAIGIEAPFETVFTYVANPATLAEWTHALKSTGAGRARMETPDGAIDVGLRVESDRNSGVIDWILQFPDDKLARAEARVVRNGERATIFTFVLHSPPVPQEQVEGSLEQQKNILRGELQELKRRLERHA
jgi:uncharacterized protein YndB with AHSA1/START domain